MKLLNLIFNSYVMLIGATKNLKRFASKLIICTYHLKDDRVF